MVEMASTSTIDPSSAMEKSPNWLNMPEELMVHILHRLPTIQKFNSVRKVCTIWRRICKAPAMWKVIHLNKSLDDLEGHYDLEALTKHAVDLSCGELVDISIDGFGTDALLHHIVLRSNKLKSLRLGDFNGITGSELIRAVKRVPQLEKLHLYYISISAEDIEVIGRNCSQLKSFKMYGLFGRSVIKCNDDALAIANNMPELRYLQVSGSHMTKIGLEAILNGCPHLESLDVRMCYNINITGNEEKLYSERIKDFKYDSREHCISQLFMRVLAIGMS